MRRFPNAAPNKRPTCSYCGIYGHSVDKCYKKFGYPPGYKAGTKSYNTAINQVESSAYLNDAKGKQVRIEPLQHTNNTSKGKQVCSANSEDHATMIKNQMNQLFTIE